MCFWDLSVFAKLFLSDFLIHSSGSNQAWVRLVIEIELSKWSYRLKIAFSIYSGYDDDLNYLSVTDMQKKKRNQGGSKYFFTTLYIQKIWSDN